VTDFDRVYKLTVIEAPDVIDVQGFDASFFEELQTITEITDHRIQFKIEKHLRKTPNQAEIVITNLAPQSREAFVSGPAKVRIEAGYDGTPRLLFIGDLRHASNEHVGTEWLTKLQLADGARAYAQARVNRSYAKGTPITSILGDIARGFGVPLPPEVNASADLRARLTTGEVITGYASDELTRLLAQFGFEWSFQNGVLQILRVDAALPGSVRVLSVPPDGGIIGAPTIDPPKIRAPSKAKKSGRGSAPRVPKMKLKHSLFPDLIPGERIEVQSRSLNGIFRIDSLLHEGDNHGGDWTTTIEGTAA
jgi:hypothetical protein